MAFHTDLTEHEEVILRCNHEQCAFIDKLTVRIRVKKKTGMKTRVSITADKEVDINKTVIKRRRGKNAKRPRNNQSKKDDRS